MALLLLSTGETAVCCPADLAATLSMPRHATVVHLWIVEVFEAAWLKSLPTPGDGHWSMGKEKRELSTVVWQSRSNKNSCFIQRHCVVYETALALHAAVHRYTHWIMASVPCQL